MSQQIVVVEHLDRRPTDHTRATDHSLMGGRTAHTRFYDTLGRTASPCVRTPWVTGIVRFIRVSYACVIQKYHTRMIRSTVNAIIYSLTGPHTYSVRCDVSECVFGI